MRDAKIKKNKCEGRPQADKCEARKLDIKCKGRPQANKCETRKLKIKMLEQHGNVALITVRCVSLCSRAKCEMLTH